MLERGESDREILVGARPFAIYVRVSEVGGREGESFSSPDEQEAAARRWAEQHGGGVFFTEEDCIDLDAVHRADPAVAGLVYDAVRSRDPHVDAILQAAGAYGDAIEAVEEAQRALAEYRDDIQLQRVLGMADWTDGPKVRREAVEVARRALRETPRPAAQDEPAELVPIRRVVAAVLVYPAREANGGSRLRLRWRGSDEEIELPAFAAA